MPSTAAWKIRDASNEYSTFQVPIINLTGANYAANIGLVTALQNALINIILGNVASRAVAAEQASINDNTVANQFAQRENKAMVVYRNTVNNALLRAEIPTPDLAKLVPGTDLFDLADADMAAFVAAFEAIVQADGTSVVNVEEIRFVARNI